MMHRSARIMKLISWLLIILLIVVGCSKAENKTIFLTIDGKVIYEDEVMLYLLQTFNEFEELGGEDVWAITDFSGGKSASDVAKQGALDNLILTKVLVSKAEALNLVVDEETALRIATQASKYFDDLEPSFVKDYDITLEAVNSVLQDNQLALMVEDQTKDNYEVTLQAMGEKKMANEEYVWLTEQIGKGVDLILTLYTIEHLVVYTHEKDAEGLWQPMDSEDQLEAINKIGQAISDLSEGKAFDEVVLAYTEDKTVTAETMRTQVSKLQMPIQFSEVLEKMEIGTYSDVIKGDTGMHIFKLIDKELPTQEAIIDFEESFSQWEESLEVEARNAIVEDGVQVLYEKWQQNATVTVEEPWSKVDILTLGSIESQ